MGKQVEAIRQCLKEIRESKECAIGCIMTAKDFAELWEEAQAEGWVKRTMGWQVAKFKAENSTDPDVTYFMDDVDMKCVIEAADGDSRKVEPDWARKMAEFMATPFCDC
jgi:hypothetical protein